MRLKSGGDEERQAAARRAEEAGERGAGERREKQNGGVRGDVLRRAKLPNRAFDVRFFSWLRKAG